MIRLLILASLGALIGGFSVPSKIVNDHVHNLGVLFGVNRKAATSNFQNPPHNLGWLFGVDRKAATELEEENIAVCNNDECKLIAKVMKESMNESVDPCDDFYEYACGKWAANNPLEEGEHVLNLWNMVEDNIENQVQEMIHSKAKPDDALAVKLAKKWYHTCMDTERMDKKGLEPVVSTVWRFGGWPLIMEEDEWDEDTYTWQKVDAYYSHLIGQSFIYRLYVGKINWEDDTNSAVIIPPDLPHKLYKLWKTGNVDSEEEEEDGEGSQERGSEEQENDDNDSDNEVDDEDEDEDEDEELRKKKVTRGKSKVRVHRSRKSKNHRLVGRHENMKRRIKREAMKAKIHAKRGRKQKKIIKTNVHRSETKSKRKSTKMNKVPSVKRTHQTHAHSGKKIISPKTKIFPSEKHIRVWPKKNNVGVESDDDEDDSTITISEESDENDDGPNDSDEKGDDETDEDDNDEDDSGSGDSGDDEDEEDDETDDEESDESDEEEEAELDPESIKKYSKFMLNVGLALSEARGIEISTERMNKQIDDVIQFLIKLKTIIYARDPDFVNMTLADFQETYDSYEPTTINGKINWVKMIERLFAEAGVEIDSDLNIGIACPRYIKELRALLDETPQQTIVNYIHWNFISTMIQATTTEMRDLYSEWDNGKKETEESRSEDCIQEVEMTDTIGYEYVKKHFSDDIERLAKDMIDDIQKEVEYQIKESKWMDEETKDFVLDKLVNMKRMVGYPDWYRNATLVKRRFRGLTLGPSYYDNILYYSRYFSWTMLRELLNDDNDEEDEEDVDFSPLMLNAFFIPTDNSIAITAVDFQSPFFARKRPRNINYGIIGFVMAHEVNHGFDDSGHLYDKKGRVMDWLSAMAEAYNKRAECFVDQFDHYSLIKSENFTVEHYGNKTAGENIADTMGLQAVFRAYQRRERECERPDPPLPGLEKFNSDQLFFLSFANLWCENMDRDAVIDSSKYDVHSTGRLRVIGSVSNSPDFAKAFNCPVGSPMNPEKKCNIWN